MERLQKLIAHSGIASRRSAEELIKAGRVTVDGVPAHLGQKVDAEVVAVELDGIPLPIKPDAKHILLNKPKGVVSTADDPQGRPTVVSLIGADTRLYPAGRLDADSEGLLIVTNDGDLTEFITHPRHGVTKTYLAEVVGAVTDRTARHLEAGVDLDDGPAAAVTARVVDRTAHRSAVEVVMNEGRNREVRRMFEAVEHPIERLVRVAVGPISDHTLKPGEWRPLTTAEIRSLYAAGERGG